LELTDSTTFLKTRLTLKCTSYRKVSLWAVTLSAQEDKRMKPLSIGAIAKAAGVSVEAIRYYEKEKLLEKAKRSEGGYRQYSPDVIRRLSFIGRAKELGFSLDEIRELLRLRMSPKSSCSSVRARAEKKIAIVDAKIAELGRIKVALEILATSCTQGDAPTSACPILDAFDQERKQEVAE
jgi:MerR family copper efflux transcriptional regulator